MILLRMIAFRPAAVYQPQTAAGDSPAKKPEPPVTPVALGATPEASQSPDTQRPPQKASAAPLPAESATRSSSNGHAAKGALETWSDSPEAAESDDGSTQAAQIKAASAGVHAKEVVSGQKVAAPTNLSRKPPISAPRKIPSINGMANDAPAASQSGISRAPVQMAQERVIDETPSRQVSLTELTTETWPELFEAFQFSGILHNIALNLQLTEVTGERLNFSLAERDATLLNERHPAQLAQALTRHLGHEVGAEIIVADHNGHTPANHRAALAAARLAAAEQAISSDDALHALMKAFDGQIIPGSIQPNVADGEHEGHGADAESRV